MKRNDPIFARLQQLFDIEAFSAAHVLIVGCGSGGSLVAQSLVMSGITSFELVDNDFLEVENVIRHACGVRYLGWKKIDAVEDMLRQRNPDISVLKHHTDLMEFSELEDCVRRATIVVLATDNEPTRWKLNELCVRTETPYCVGRVFTRGIGGEVFAYRPDEHGCLGCLEMYLGRQPKLRAGTKEIEYATEEQKQAVYGHEIEEIKDSPGLTVDISFITAFHSRFALDLVARALTRPKFLAPIDENYLIWGNRPAGPFSRNFQLQTFTMPALTECMVCGEVE